VSDSTQRRNIASTARLSGTLAAVSLMAGPAHASFLSGDALDTAADYMSWFVICVIPIALLVIFWMVHVLPEKIAHKRHHPQTKAIQVLCLLSLVFGGLLWPLAWLWAYTRPTSYRLAYGTDKHEDYHLQLAAKEQAGGLQPHEVVHLRDELAAMQARGALPAELIGVRERLDARATKPTAEGST
jgi:CBS domain containing-hemolysin-like protein